MSDFPVLFRFYRDVIGLTPQFDNDQGPYGAFKPEHGSTIALHDRADLVDVVPELESGGGDRALVVLRVDDLDVYRAELSARGAGQVSEPRVLWDRIRVAYLRDPEGNLLELQQWLTTRDGGTVPSAN